MNKRIEWIDQLKGFGIFLVVYGHNFPITEKYIYSFHMPLFFIVAGIFHPVVQNKKSIVKRVKTILIPYFLWSLFLFLFWVIIGRFYGESANYNLSVYKNLIGVFYAQGDRAYMDWGIPMWFLPTIFLTFLSFYLIRLIKNKAAQNITLLFCVLLGFSLPRYYDINFMWSADVALVSLIFYTIGFYFKQQILNPKKSLKWPFLLAIGGLHFGLFYFNHKVDMYRSEYGNELLFILNGVLGTLFYISLFKLIPRFKIFEFIGKFTIPILALQIRALTFIKLFLLIFFGMQIFEFSELEKLVLSIIQIILMIPILIMIKKYFPILNGGSKKI